MTVHLRPSAKWQDGQAFTSQDVVTSLMLQGINGNNIWHDLTGVTAPNSHTVVLNLKPKMPSQIVLSDLLGMTPVSNSQYGQFVPPHLMSDLFELLQPLTT